MKRWIGIGVAMWIAACMTAWADGPASPVRPVFGPIVKTRVKAIFAQLQTDHDYRLASHQADQLFDVVAQYAPATDVTAFIESAYAARLLRHFQFMPADRCDVLLTYLRRFDELAKVLAFLVTDNDQPSGVYGVLTKLTDAYGDKPGVYATLTAALCVVHDTPLRRKLNDRTVEGEDPIKLFDYYVTYEHRMLFGIKTVPAELLVWVVDSTAKVDEMRWALAGYRGDRAVGKHFFDVSYDYEYFRTGRNKRLDAVPLTLENIRMYGGVCVDQAYFAMTVGKAIGVPTAMVIGRSAEASHAWVGFLEEKSQREAAWNFDVGRYPEYQGIRGLIIDPQTGKPIPDGYLAVQAELIGTQTSDRRVAAALTDAAVRLSDAPQRDPAAVAKILGIDGPVDLPDPRTDAIEPRLELIESALKRNPGDARAWFVVRDLAATGKMTLAQKHWWAVTLQRLTAHRYPDFTLAMLRPMIASIDDPGEQERIWEAAIGLLNDRMDLVAEVRMAQAQLWEERNHPDLARPFYEDVIDRFANAGPFVIAALEKDEALLKATGKTDQVLPLYAGTWEKLTRPTGMAGEFTRQSNWYRIGTRYVQKLRDAGQTQQADAVESQIKQVVGG